MECSMSLFSSVNKGMGIVQYVGIPHAHARTLDGDMKILEGFTLALCIVCDIRVLEHPVVY
jgi:hypothetical protein